MKNFISNTGIIILLLSVIGLTVYMTQEMISNVALGFFLILIVGGIITYIITNRLYNN